MKSKTYAENQLLQQMCPVLYKLEDRNPQRIYDQNIMYILNKQSLGIKVVKVEMRDRGGVTRS